MAKPLDAVARWLDTVVIGLNFCPFAKHERIHQRIHFVQSNATTEQQLLFDLAEQLQVLSDNPDLATTLLVHPKVLQDFTDYNQFLDLADQLLVQLNFEGVFQVASFHPDYQFAGTSIDDAENFTNRSPYPLLHILREDSLQQAIQRHPDTGQIPQTNIQRAEQLGVEHLHTLLQNCVLDNGQG